MKSPHKGVPVALILLLQLPSSTTCDYEANKVISITLVRLEKASKQYWKCTIDDIAMCFGTTLHSILLFCDYSQNDSREK